MNIKVETSAFKKALSKIAALPGANSADEASKIITIGADMEGFQLFRFSATSSIRTNGECTVIEEGKITTTFELLNRVFANISGEVEIKAIKEGVEILGLSGRSVLKAVQSDLKPPPRPLNPIPVVLKAGELSHAIQHGITAAANANQSKPEWEGAVIKEAEGKLLLIGADGRRLHISVFDVTDDEALALDGLTAVLSKESVHAASKLLSDEVASADIRIEFTADTMTLIGEQFKFLFTLLKYEIPNQLLAFTKTQRNPLITLNRRELIAAVRAGSAFANSDLRQIRLTITKKYLQVVSRDQSGSEYEHKIAGTNGVGVALDKTVNWDYMIDFLESLRGDTITILHDPFTLAVEEPGKHSILCTIRTSETAP